jgi:hypothetical protein
VANDPQRYGFHYTVGRNPDVAWLDLDDYNRVIIKGIGEITNERQLSKRKFLQLSESGFAQNLRNVARQLNSMQDGEARGLSEFGQNKKQVEVSPTLKKYLIVHHNMDTSSEGLKNSIGQVVTDAEYSNLDDREKKKVFSETEKQSFINLLNSPDTVIIKSVFDNNENRIITDFIIEKIKERYPDYKTN